MTGARWLAAERGAFDLEPVGMQGAAEADGAAGKTAPAMTATATLGEIAAAHDGQPPEEWMRVFLMEWRQYGDRE